MAGEFEWQGRGRVWCGAGPLLVAALGESGQQARLGLLGSRRLEGRGDATAFAVSYLDRDGRVAGFAVAAHESDRQGLVVAQETVERWSAVLRSRLLLVADTDPLCPGERRAARMVCAAESARTHGVYALEDAYGFDDAYADADADADADAGADVPARKPVAVRRVRSLEEVPGSAVLAIPAFGVPLATAAEAAARGLAVIDATCPLVEAVCADVRRYAERGDTVVVLGRSRHAVTRTLVGQAPGSAILVEDAAQAAALDVPDRDRVSFVAAPGQPVREVMNVLAVLRARFPGLCGHHFDILCHAASDRDATIHAAAADADVVLVLGSGSDHDSRRTAALAARAARAGAAVVHVVDRLGEIRAEWLASATSIGLINARTAPTRLAGQVCEALAGLGPLTLARRAVTTVTAPREAEFEAPWAQTLAAVP